MGQFLDQQISQNASTSGAISIPITGTPALFATLGLDLTGAGQNVRVAFSGNVTISSIASVLTPITIQVFRVVSGVSTLIYSVTNTLPVAGLGVASVTPISFSGADYQPFSPTNFVVYRVLISTPGGIILFPTRTGPETFEAAAYSN